MKYTYRLDGQTARYLRRLQPDQAARVLTVLRTLCEDPFDDSNSTALHGAMGNFRRARAGQLRIIFRVERELLLVFVTAIGPRGDVYKS